MHGDVGVEGAGGDGEGMPLLRGHIGDLDEKPLSRLVFHAGFGELDLHSVVGMSDHLGDSGFSASADFAVDTLDEVHATAEEFPAPAFVADAVGPEVVAGEGGVGVGAVSHETACGVRVHAEEEGDEEVVSVPEGFV